MAEKRTGCPQCEQEDASMTVRAAYQDREGVPGGPPWTTVAPPPIPLERFAVMVVTMAERAYGGAPVPTGGPPPALV